MKKLFEKFGKRNMIFAYSILALIAVLTIASGGWAAFGAIGIAMALPALTDQEAAFLEVVKAEVAKAQEKFNKDYISATKMDELIKAAIDKALEGVTTKDDLKELNAALEKQGLTIRKLEGDKVAQVDIKSVFKSAFAKEGLAEDLVKAYKNNGVVEVLKAVGTVTTGSVSTDTGGSALLDMLNADEINSMRLRNQFIEDFCTVTRTSKPIFTYVDYIPKEGSVSFVGQAGSKTQIDLQATVKTLVPKKAAGWTKLTEEAVTDVPRMESEARVNIFKKYILRRQHGILFGDGNNDTPIGITALAPAFNGATWTGEKKETPNLYDAIVAAKNQIELAANYADDVDYYPNVVFLNPADYNAILIKQDEKTYVFANVNGMKLMNVDGIAVVPKKEIPTGKMLIGDFTKLEIINYIDYNVKIGWVNDDFIKNQFIMLGEGRFFVLLRELDKKAFIYDDIANILAGITA